MLGMIVTAISCIVYILRPPSFDEHEYLKFVQMITHAQLLHDSCGTPKTDRYITQLYVDSLSLKNYTEFRDNNQETKSIAIILHETVRELNYRYKSNDIPSTIYCQTKSINIEEQSTLGAKATQQKVKVKSQP